MKSLVVFYSLEGHTKSIADIIRKELNCDLLELKPEKEIPKTGIRKFFWGGKSVIFNEKPTLKNQIPNLNEYDAIFIGTPIWAGKYTPAINTFISQNKIKGKNIGFFACHGGGGAKKCFQKLEDILKDNTIIGSIDFIDSEDETERKDKVKHWLSNIVLL
ncbi:flavodoxin [Clostridium sporogenes]|uniref:Flavodoxin n=1 Tax=Clostridium sporogenes TaxID=1509 RepID=A0AAE4FLT8_CLOSG|nr:flavodoxin [Clostridium sporogenes]MDS1003481.1 flavodoxin [Clostridium sporogenes]NFN87660.1 flavodoxin [Clostridium sporogenes]NFS25955.1 flavodoxin [Clostridium sporogenes]